MIARSMLRRLIDSLVLALLICLTGPSVLLRAQANKIAPQKSTKQDDQEPIRITTEEVRLPVVAFDEKNRFDVALVPDDILLLEDGVPQQVKSVRRIPSHVLFLLDTGGEGVGLGGLSKSVSLTRRVAQEVLSKLSNGDQIALLQVNNRVELLQNWTTDKTLVRHALETKLIGAKQSRFTEGIIAAAQALKDQPEGSRHVVMITDGLGTSGASTDRAEAIRQLIAARATVHIISYTTYVRQKSDKSHPKVYDDAGAVARQQREGIERASIDPTMPPGQSRGGISTGIGAGGTITFDPAMRRVRKAYEENVRRSEQNLTTLAEETGARVFLPKSSDEMTASGADVAHDIEAQYVVTYTPKRPLTTSPAGEYRRIAIAPRRIGLQMRTRRGYIVVPQGG